MELDLRKLRYFLVTAEELNFSKAAEKLFIAQPVLSRQITALEIELGTTLFERSSKGTTLTPAGVELALEARRLLESAAALQRRAQIVGQGRTHVTIGVMPGLSISKVIKRLAETHPSITLDIVSTSWHSQTDVVRDGRADLSIVRLPVDTAGLRTVPLYTEKSFVALPPDHPLVRQETVHLEEIAGEILLQPSDAFPQWRAAAVVQNPDNLLARSPLLDNPPELPFSAAEEMLAHVANGRGIALLPDSARYIYAGADVAYRHVTDLDPIQFVAALNPQRTAPIFEEVVAVAYEVLGIECPLRTPSLVGAADLEILGRAPARAPAETEGVCQLPALVHEPMLDELTA